MRLTPQSIAALALLTSASGLLAQTTAPAPLNVANLSASSSIEVMQDLLTLTLSTTRDGADAAVVQTQLKTVLDTALTEMRKIAQPGYMDVRTGGFSMSPRYDKKNQINGWEGTADLVLEGRDIPRIAAAAGQVRGMAVAHAGFNLSRETRSKVAGEAQTQAIANFKANATEITRSFGFTSYTLREVSINADSGQMQPSMLMASRNRGFSSMETTPIPVEAGKSTVTVNVSGSVQMR